MRLLDIELIESELLRMRHRESRMARLLGLVYALSSLLPGPVGVRQACDRIARTVVEDSGFEECTISLRDDEGEAPVRVASATLAEILGEDSDAFRPNDGPCDVDPAVLTSVLSKGEPRLLDCPQAVCGAAAPDSTPASRCTLLVPLRDRGVMQLVSQRPISFSTQDSRDWTMLGNIVAQIVRTELLHEKLSTDNLGLRNEIEVKNRELEQRYEEISVANRFLEQIIDHSPEGMCILDYHGQVVRMNRKMKAVWGRNADDLQNRSPAVIFQDPSLFFNLFERAAKGERASLSDVYMMGSDGKPHPAEVFLTRLDRQTERCDAYLLVLYDQTEKRAFQEHMLRTEKLAALGTMAGGVAHDFNNLLMTMLGNTQLLLLHTPDDKSRQRLESIEMAIQDAAHSLRRLNAFTLDPRKEDPLRVGVVNVDDVIRDAIELTRPRWKNASEKQGHIIEFRHEKCGTRQVAMHASDLREVLTNLILNAVDSMPGGGILTLRSGEDAQQVRIDVSDTGTGIHTEIARKIFDPFFTTKGVGNSGLGLSVCWSLVIRHGGTIEVKSQPGQGSTFSIVLPKGVPRVETVKVDKPVPCPAGCRVLLVDDDKEVLAILRDMIRLSGHKVTATDCPGEALSLLDAEPFDLVVTDLGMPLVTGWEVARKARAINPGVPVVVVTGWGAQYEEADFRAKGIDMVLSKPVNYEKLQNVLQRFLDSGETHH